MILQIAHQGVRSTCSPAAPAIIHRSASLSQKTRMAPCRNSIRLPFPTPLGIVPVDRRAMPPLTTAPVPSLKAEETAQESPIDAADALHRSCPRITAEVALDCRTDSCGRGTQLILRRT
jgi:hypothetical protein